MEHSLPPTPDNPENLDEAWDLLAELPEGFGPGCEAPSQLHDLGMRALVGVAKDAERLISWLRFVQLAATDRMIDAVLDREGHEPEELNGRGSDPQVRHLVESVVAEELVLATGMPTWEAEARAGFVTAGPEAGRRLAAALRAGECSWERVRRVRERTIGQASCVVDEVARRVLAPPRAGDIVSWNQFGRRLSQAMLACADSPTARAKAHETRDATARFTDHGMARYTVTGPADRVGAAHQRIDALARRLRAAGDARTLAQLRADLALELLIDGRLDGFAAGVPAGRVNVTVSLASLVGYTDDPGQTAHGPLAADIVRELALAEGSTLARIVTDPHTGEVLDASTEKYRPTAAMRRFITARYGTCTAPGCVQPAQTCELDHGTPWPRGTTTTKNLTPKGGRHHEYKTRGWWRFHHDEATGTITWETLGGTYTRYPLRFGHDPDDPAGPDGCSPDGTTLAPEDAARIAAYRAHADQCILGGCSGEPTATHDNCDGSTAWIDPALPDERCGTARPPTAEDMLHALRAEQRYRRSLRQYPPLGPDGTPDPRLTRDSTDDDEENDNGGDRNGDREGGGRDGGGFTDGGVVPFMIGWPTTKGPRQWHGPNYDDYVQPGSPSHQRREAARRAARQSGSGSDSGDRPHVPTGGPPPATDEPAPDEPTSRGPTSGGPASGGPASGGPASDEPASGGPAAGEPTRVIYEEPPF